ncbi:MAG: HAD family phosphatase [Herpetosiphonaceae bacterium]|nr:HAD family phosphatase [Herpetosiphonaceae bacterium]
MDITTLLFDLGGVCLSNGWDHEQRQRVATQFGFEYEAYDARHRQVVDSLERGQLSLEDYLDWTLFYEPRPFTRPEIEQAIFDLSTPIQPTLDLVRRLHDGRRYMLATLNNESLELNNFRINKFKLCEIFTVFFSSCYLNMTKPTPTIYRHALDLLQREPGECLFVDDRPMNCEVARILGMQTIQFKDADQLAHELKQHGVEV